MSSIATQNVKPTPLNNASGLNLTGIHGLPEGFPLAVPNAWNGQEPADMVEQWIHHMTRADCVELREGLRKFKGKTSQTVNHHIWAYQIVLTAFL